MDFGLLEEDPARRLNGSRPQAWKVKRGRLSWMEAVDSQILLRVTKMKVSVSWVC